MDLLELFERDTPERDRSAGRQPRKGLRGLLDRLTATLGGEDGERDARRRHRERHSRDETDLGFD
jgi:hypothetical protein